MISRSSVTGQDVRFTLQGERSFTYTVTASSTEGSYPFEGSLRDSDRMDSLVGGATECNGRDRPTPDPTPVAPVATEEPEESGPPSLADSSIIAAVNGDAAIIGPLAMIIVKDQGSAAAVPSITAQPNATPPVAGFTNPAIVNGGPMYTPTGSTEQSPLFAVGGSLAGGYTIGLAGGVDNNDLTSDSYSFQVRIVLDEDGADGADTDNLLEHDIPLTANVTINVMRVEGNGNNFDVDPSKAIKGSAVSGLGRPIDTNPLEWKVTGVASSAKLVNISSNNGIVEEDFQVREYPVGSGTFRLFVVNSGAGELGATAPINLTLTYDEDTTTDSDGTGGQVADKNADVTIGIRGAITKQSALTFSTTPVADGIDFAFTVAQNISAGTPIGFFGISGRISDDEYLDGIISGPNAGLFDVNDADMTLVYKGSGMLDVGVYDLDLTVSGDAGMANRTIIGKAEVTVTASNQAATAPETFKKTIKENVEGVDAPDDPDTTATDPKPGLVSAGTAVGDASYGVTNPDNDSLVYSITTSTVFEIDPSTGMVTVGDAGISDTGGGPTETDDEAEYTRSGTDSGELVEPTKQYSDITYEFDIKVSDGVSANDKIIKATVTVNVNDTVSVDDATAEEDDDGNKYFEAGYTDTDPFGTTIFDLATVLTDDQMASDLDYDLKVTGPENVAPATFTVSPSGVVQLNFPGIVRGADFWMVEITIDDGFVNTPLTEDEEDAADARDPDAVITLKISVVDGIRPDRVHHEVAIAENTAGGTEIVDLTTILNAIDGAEEFESVGGDGETKFAVSADGKITVKMDADLDVDAADADDSYLLSVSVTGANQIDLGEISVVIDVMGVNEAPVFDSTDDYARGIPENAQSESEVGAVVKATDPESGDDITFSVKETKMPFTVDTSENADGSFSGQIEVDGTIAIANSPYTITVVATDNGSPVGSTEQVVIITIGDINDAPEFDNDTGATSPTLHVTIAENSVAGTAVATYNATDADGGDIIQGVNFVLRNADDTQNFSIVNMTTSGEISGILTVSDTANLEYDIEQDSPAPVTYTVEVNVCDADVDCNEIALIVTLENSDDEAPIIGNTDDSQDVPENSARGTSLGDYSATDKDNLNDPGFDVTKYSLRGTHAKFFNISDTGELMTLAALDYDRINANGTRGVPCVSCEVTVVATDKDGTEDTQPVTISVSPVEDSVSTLDVTKANPVPGTEMGKATSALAGTKVGSDEYLWNMLDCYEMKALVDSTDDSTYCKMWDGLSPAAQATVSAALGKDAEERPGDLPVTYGSAPMNFVQTEWANWGTVLRIAVTSESPSETCGNGNQCVVIDINSDSADDSLKLRAYRSGGQENEYVAAVMLVEESKHATSSDAAVYMHGDALHDDDPNAYVLAPRLKVDEEDEIEVEFGNLRGSIDVENEAPEISNFAPEHEAAFDDADVDYTFTVTDSLSGLPEPEDLPDTDGDENYTPAVALISENQCVTYLNTATVDTKVLKVAANIHEDETLYCPGTPSEGEYIATETISDFGFAPIRDDKDFDEIDNGYDVETTIVLAKNEIFYVTFIACDNAGNCTFYDPDGNDDEAELAEITVDTEDPVFVEARTGLTWDSTDNEYDDNRSFIQVIFNDLTPLNTATVEIDDFVVEGHTIKDVHIFENPDSDDKADGDWHARYGAAGSNNLRGIARYRDIENAVFVELEDELLADETPDVTIVPNGVEDKAGNEQDDGDHEADDWISPTFTIVSIVSTRETSQDEVLAGDDDEVTVVVTADERLDQTRPTVTVTYVNATMIDTKGIADCDDGTKDGGTRQRGEIVNNDKCVDNGAATGGSLNNSVEKVSNTEWVVTITEPKDTGYYNFHISGKDRSPQENPGSEGVDPEKIVKDFFDADGDVNVDDAVFFEGDINLPKPQVRVSGVGVENNEADVEFRSPLFVELDFAANHSNNCRTTDNDVLMANCTNENSEYAEDNFDDIVVTSFVLDGVDITDSVKTTDNQSFLISLESISIGDHTAEVQAVDQAGNVFEDTLEIDFEVNDRDPFEKRLSPGWNLVSLPGEPADSSIAAVFGPDVEVRTVYSYDPVIPGGWQVAVRETLDSDWQGDLTEIDGRSGYWVLSDAIQDWEVSIPRLAGGAAGTGTPIQPPVIPLYAGWNLIPVSDISGNGSGGDTLSADVYLQSLDDGIDLARVLGFDTIRNQWETVLDPDMQMNNTLTIGSGYWIFVREATSLVPSGYVGGGGAD